MLTRCLDIWQNIWKLARLHRRWGELLVLTFLPHQSCPVHHLMDAMNLSNSSWLGCWHSVFQDFTGQGHRIGLVQAQPCVTDQGPHQICLVWSLDMGLHYSTREGEKLDISSIACTGDVMSSAHSINQPDVEQCQRLLLKPLGEARCSTSVLTRHVQCTRKIWLRG